MKTIEEILREEEENRKAMEETQEFRGFKIAFLRQISEKIFNPENWKRPWAASVPYQMGNAVYAAVEFFHADRPTLHGAEPITGNLLFSGRGYQG